MAGQSLTLNGRHVVITGGSTGLGEALALEIATHGAKVTLLARRQVLLDEVAARVRERGSEALAVATDVTSQESVESALAQAVEQFGPVDVLIANSGVSPDMSVHDLDVPVIENAMRVNYFGVVYAMHAVLPSMIERKTGTIMAISSLAAFRGLPTCGPYCASKSAVSAWMESLRSELRPVGVKLITSHPGYIRTAMTAKHNGKLPFMVDVEDAARGLVREMLKGRSEINFPWQLAVAVKVARRLPNDLYDRLIWSAGSGAVTWRTAAKDACLWLAFAVATCLLARLAPRWLSPSTAETLHQALPFALPILGLLMLGASREVRGSTKVPILIVALGLPIAAITGITRLLGLW